MLSGNENESMERAEKAIARRDRRLISEACAEQLEKILKWLPESMYEPDNVMSRNPELHIFHVKKVVEWLAQRLRDGAFLQTKLGPVETRRTDPLMVWFVARVVKNENSLGAYLIERGAYIRYEDAVAEKERGNSQRFGGDPPGEYTVRALQLHMSSVPPGKE